MPVHLGVLEEVAGGDMRGEGGRIQKEIMLAMHLSGPWGAGGAGNGIFEIARLAQRADDGRLARAGGGGDHEKNAGAA